MRSFHLVGLLLLRSLLAPAFAGAQDAAEIVTRSEDHLRGKTSRADMTISIVRPKWSREMAMKTWSKGDDLFMILVTSPAKDAGTAFLKRGKDLWNWVPAVERNVKLPPSMMSQNWMGTDFTNDDLVREANVKNDYDHRIEGEEDQQGRKCWKIRMTPHEDAGVVWDHVLVWIDQQDYLQLRSEFYDEDGALVNTMVNSDIRTMGGRTIPAKMEMTPADKPGHKTVITYTDLEYDIPISDDFFTVQQMRNVK
ncbi:MAG: outer membrane lipoprotein-sorting protein [Flavobacteriales bacterium]|nr:outer membrane lipoprotein-sorting protein [Flavobacteriales bacterium]MCB9167865.1 outer membrane lipoprotein-sorting protein [Flavobacteriales bacterium]